jgi:hypothetical protein
LIDSKDGQRRQLRHLQQEAKEGNRLCGIGFEQQQQQPQAQIGEFVVVE